MIKMLLNLNKVLHISFINNFFNRLVNKYTVHGAIIILIQLEALGILPSGTSQNIDGLSNKEILIYTGIAVGMYLIFHVPKPKSKLEKIQYLIELKKAELDLELTKEELKKIRQDKLNHIINKK